MMHSNQPKHIIVPIFSIIWMLNAIITAVVALINAWMFVGGGSGPHNDMQGNWVFSPAAIALWGSKKLMTQNRKRFAWLLLSTLTIPCLLLFIFIMVVAKSDLHWQ